MHKRILILLTLMLVSCLSISTTSFSSDKILEVEYHQLTKDARKEIDCLADNVYHEAGYETEQGRMAVAFVTLNRVQEPRFPTDLCSVVKQKTKYTC